MSKIVFLTRENEFKPSCNCLFYYVDILTVSLNNREKAGKICQMFLSYEFYEWCIFH